LVDATKDTVVAKVDAIKVDVVVAKEVVATVVMVVAKVDVVKVEVVVDVAEAEEAAAAQHKVVRVSEVSLISLSRPGANHHCSHNRRYRKNHKHTSHNVRYLLISEAGLCLCREPRLGLPFFNFITNCL
jgi:hypothetical protein